MCKLYEQMFPAILHVAPVFHTDGKLAYYIGKYMDHVSKKFATAVVFPRHDGLWSAPGNCNSLQAGDPVLALRKALKNRGHKLAMSNHTAIASYRHESEINNWSQVKDSRPYTAAD